MSTNMYIFKVQPAFVEESTRYIVKMHQVGTPKTRYASADSLVELADQLKSLPAFNWSEIEASLESKGGYRMTLDMNDFEFHQLFGL